MSEFKDVLNLPVDDLKERRKVLEEELGKVIVEDVSNYLKTSIEEALKERGIALTEISWEFHPESDDEGGVDYWPSYIQLFTEDGELDEEDVEDIEIKVKSNYSDFVYSYDVFEFVSEKLHDNSSDLYNYNIESLSF